MAAAFLPCFSEGSPLRHWPEIWSAIRKNSLRASRKGLCLVFLTIDISRNRLRSWYLLENCQRYSGFPGCFWVWYHESQNPVKNGWINSRISHCDDLFWNVCRVCIILFSDGSMRKPFSFMSIDFFFPFCFNCGKMCIAIFTLPSPSPYHPSGSSQCTRP